MPRPSAWSLRERVYPIALILAISGCHDGGASRGGGAAGGGLDAEGQAWILGTWEGPYKNLNAASDSEFRQTTARLTFKAADESSGEFQLDFPELDGVYTRGTFNDFGREKIVLKIGESTLSSLGRVGSSRIFKYVRYNKELEIFDDRIEMSLVRVTEGGSGDARPRPGGGNGGGDGSEDGDQHPVVGLWTCQDGKGRGWRIHVMNETRFSAEVREQGRPLLWMSGAVTIAEQGGADARLVVSDSRVEAYIGWEYALTSLGQDGLEVARLGRGAADDPNRPVIERFDCERAD